jgi:hypothetical protein
VRAPARPAARWTPLSALPQRHGLNAIVYAGHWQFVRHATDGRYAGCSARSFHAGDSMAMVLAGTRFRIFGIRGVNGGSAEIVIPGRPVRVIDFFARSKEVHQRLFDSGALDGIVQSASLVVVAPRNGHRQGYVNVEEVEVDSGG